MNPTEIIKQLQATSSRLDKETIVKTAWDLKIYDFFKGVQLAYDPLKTFGVKQVLISENNLPSSVNSFEDFVSLTNDLIDRKLTGNAAQAALESFSNKVTADEWNFFYRGILCKDLRAGLSETTVNKVLEKIGGDALDYITKVFTCQLAFNSKEHRDKLTGQAFLEPKYDGVRILAIYDDVEKTTTMYTRDGRINENFPFSKNEVMKFASSFGCGMVFDGEMMSSTFQKLMKQVNRKKDVDTSDAIFHIFDMVPLNEFRSGKSSKTLLERRELLKELQEKVKEYQLVNVNVLDYPILVDLDTDEGLETLSEFKKSCVSKGFEGVMIKLVNEFYERKRSKGWLKYKPNMSFDLKIVGVNEGKAGKQFEGMLGAFICEGVGDKGEFIRVKVGGGFSRDMRKEFWLRREELIGSIVEVETDVITKSDNNEHYSLRFPEFVRFRDIEKGEKI